MRRMTIGCRCRIKTLEEMPQRKGPTHYSNEHSWREEYGGREILLLERSSSGGFSFMLLGKGVTELKRETTGIVSGKCAWIDEDNLVLVDADFDTNLDFIDWYQENEDNFCGDCGAWFPDNMKREDPDDGDNYRCPNPECPGARWDNGECIDCGTKLTGKHGDWCNKCKTHIAY